MYIYPQFLAHENFKNVHKKVQKGCKIYDTQCPNLRYTMSLVQGQILLKFGFGFGSQGIVVKCTAAIFFPTVDW